MLYYSETNTVKSEHLAPYRKQKQSWYDWKAVENEIIKPEKHISFSFLVKFTVSLRLRCIIWDYTVCLGHKSLTSGLYWLRYLKRHWRFLWDGAATSFKDLKYFVFPNFAEYCFWL